MVRFCFRMRMLRVVGWLGLVMLAAGICRAAELDLSGRWAFALDPDNRGVEEQWHDARLQGSIQLPGSLQAQGLGRPVGLDTPWVGGIVDQSFFQDDRYARFREADNFKIPFWLQPETYYRGAAWYQREIEVPQAWDGKRILLYLERCHWETQVWIDNHRVDRRDSLSTPHDYDLSGYLSPGRHRLSVRVDNRIHLAIGDNSHSVADHTQSNWNGLVGDLKLVATDPVWIEDVRVYPDVVGKEARVRITVGNGTGGHTEGVLRLRALLDGVVAAESTAEIQTHAPEGSWEVVLPLGTDMRTWDEFSPSLYALRVDLTASDGAADVAETTFGMREVGVAGTQITINGRPTFLRGTLECAIFPLTGYPPTDVASWRKIVRTCKAYGLNHIRFHSWCPPEAAFVAADELGFYYQVECASWANQGATVGDGKPLDSWLYEEGERITKAYGNHPSFVLMAYGNEPAGKNHKDWLSRWCTFWREREPRVLHTSGAGWPLIPESDFHNAPQPRIQAWGQELRSIINAEPPQTRFDYNQFVANHPEKPTISHEIGQWCVYPNFDEIQKYTGVLKPKNFEVFRTFLEEARMGHQAREFLMASGKLQALCYKADIEAALRTRGFGGFQLLDLHDFPGQGSALVGVLDPFWDSKGYLDAETHRRYCGPCVPLARMPKRTWAAGELFSADIEIAQFGPADLAAADVTWSLAGEGGDLVAEGSFDGLALRTGTNTLVGRVDVSLAAWPDARKLVLQVDVPEVGAGNQWDLWVYPDEKPLSPPSGIYVTQTLDADARAVLRGGGDVLLLAPPSRIRTDVKLGFSSIFWNTAWTRGQAPHTLGILCDPAHPALAHFPTESHSNWQWWELVASGATMELDGLPIDLVPIVQVVPDWFHPKRLALAFEARVNNGRIMVSSMDLRSRLAERPAANRMRTSLLRYMAGAGFAPSVSLSADQILSLLEPPSPMEQLGAAISADSEHPGSEVKLAMDGDPSTFWHSRYAPTEPLPHAVVIELPRAIALKGLAYLPRQDMRNGRATEYAVSVSQDGTTWGRPVRAGTLNPDADRKTLNIDGHPRARFVKFEVRAGVGGYASIAELEVLTDSP